MGLRFKKENRRYFAVNLENLTCSCRYWELSGVPCCHAITVIYKVHKEIEDFTAHCI
jgi:hypothetical protein